MQVKYYDWGGFLILAETLRPGLIPGFNQYSGILHHPIVPRWPLAELQQGHLTLHPGFTWNKLSGPTPRDPEETHLGSAVHDALYPMIRNVLRVKDPEVERLRRSADKFFLRLLIKKDTNKVLRRILYRAVRMRGDEHMANMKDPYEVYVA